MMPLDYLDCKKKKENVLNFSENTHTLHTK